jgi:hypothetical protein
VMVLQYVARMSALSQTKIGWNDNSPLTQVQGIPFSKQERRSPSVPAGDVHNACIRSGSI